MSCVSCIGRQILLPLSHLTLGFIFLCVVLLGRLVWGTSPCSGPALERLTQGGLSPQQVLEHQSQLLLAPQKDMHIYLSLLSSPRGCHTKEAAIKPSCPAGKLIRTVAKHPTSC